MGLLDKIFKRPTKTQSENLVTSGGYRTFTTLNPVFSDFNGKIYEQELTRAAIERFALACAKLKPEICGTSRKQIAKAVHTRPNHLMTWSTFLARVATMYECDDTVFIVPEYTGEIITGFYPVKCAFAEVLDYKGEPWIRFHFATGEVAPIELSRVCLLSRFQYTDEFFGEPNCLNATLGLIDAQIQAQENAIKNGAKIRFIGSLTGQVRESDMEEKRNRFIQSNLSSENNGGLILYDQTFTDIRQIEPQSYTVDEGEMERIEQNVYTYFGINKDILQNSYSEETWAAWYEGKIEPFAVKLGEGLTKLCFSVIEQMHGNEISFSSNRLEYASNASKRNMIRDMSDRGMMCINEGREILQLPPIPGGDIFVIRGEYVNVDSLQEVKTLNTTETKTEGESDFDEDTKETDADDKLYDNDADRADKEEGVK